LKSQREKSQENPLQAATSGRPRGLLEETESAAVLLQEGGRVDPTADIALGGDAMTAATGSIADDLTPDPQRVALEGADRVDEAD